MRHNYTHTRLISELGTNHRVWKIMILLFSFLMAGLTSVNAQQISIVPVNSGIQVGELRISFGGAPIQIGSGTIRFVRTVDGNVMLERVPQNSGSTLAVVPIFSNEVPSDQSITIEWDSGTFSNFLGDVSQLLGSPTILPTYNPPIITALSPANGSSGVGDDPTLSVTFNEAVSFSGSSLTGILITNGVNEDFYEILSSNSAFSLSNGNRTFNFDASAFDWEPNSTYEITIFDGLEDADGDRASLAGIWSFTTANFTITPPAPPTIVSFSPSDNASDVGVDDNFQISFDEAIQAGSGLATLRLSNGTVVQNFGTTNVNISGSTLTFDPTNDLLASTGYYFTIPSGFVRDLDGNDFAGFLDNTTYNFTTAAPADNVAPLIVSQNPTPNSFTHPIDANIEITFNEPVVIDDASDILLNETSGNALVATNKLITGGNTLVIDPVNDLTPNTLYTVTIVGTGIQDLAGNSLAQVSGSDYRFATPIADNTPPNVISSSPSNGETNVPVNLSTIELTYSEPIEFVSSPGPTVRLQNRTTFVSAAFPVSDMTINGSVLSVDLSNVLTNNLDANTVYRIFVDALVQDLAGNPSEVINSLNNPIDFTTESNTTPPVLAANPFSPADNASNVAVNSNVTITFSENVSIDNAGQIQLRRTSNDSEVPANKSVSGSTLTINPNSNLANSTGYYVFIGGGGIEDLAGNSFVGISGTTAYNFTTAAPSNNAPTDIQFFTTTVNENEPVNTVVGSLTTIDADPGDTHFYTLVNGFGDNGSFNIDGSNLRTSATFDFETKSSYSIRIQTDDGNGGTYQEDFTINVRNEVEIVSFSPADDATDASIDADLVVTFDQTIEFNPFASPTSGLGTIRNFSNETLVEAFTIADAVISGSTLTFDPSSNLNAESEYFVSISSGLIQNTSGRSFGGIAISEKNTWNFTTAAPADNTPPTISSRNPMDDEVDVPVGSNIEVTFSENINLVNASGIILFRQGNTIVSFSSNVVDGNKLVIDPISDLDAGIGYFLTISGSAIEDLAGNSFSGISGGTAYNFTTAAPIDNTPPVLTSTNPADDATNVSVNSSFQFNFDEPIQSGLGTARLRLLSNGSIQQSFTAASSEVVISGNTLTWNPSIDIDPNTEYYFTFPNAFVQDLAGNNLAGFSNNSTYNFTTAAPVDTDPPGLFTGFNNRIPEDDATDFRADLDIQIVFDEDVVIDNATGIEVKRLSDDQVVASSKSIAANDITLVINPTNDLEENVDYYVTIAPGAIEDLAGNDYPGFTNNTFWNFRTEDNIAPTVNSFSPMDDATNVDINIGTFTLTLSEDVQIPAITNGFFRLWNADASEVVGTFNFNSGDVTASGNVVTIQNVPQLQGSTNYFIQNNSGGSNRIQDLSGNQLVGWSDGSIWNFTTAAPVDNTPPTASFSPSDESLNVPLDQNFTITFDEPVEFADGAVVLRIGTSVVEIFSEDDLTIVGGNSITVNPSADLLPSTTYNFQIGGALIRDLAGNNFPGFLDEDSWNFTTAAPADNSPPVLQSFTPTGTIEPEAKVLTLTFDEDVRPGNSTSSRIRVRRQSDDSDVVNTTFSLADSRVDIVGNVVTLDFPGPDWPEDDYYVIIQSGGLEDLNDNQYLGFSETDVWEFTVQNPVQDQTITFNALSAKTYGDANFNLNATASSGLAVSYTSSNTNVATVSGNAVTIVGAGTTTITASQGGNGSFNPAPDVQRTLTVNKKNLTATADDKTKVYGTNNPALTISYSGFVPGDDVSDLNTSPSVSTTATSASDAGTYPITLSGGNDNNYSFTLEAGDLTVNKRNLTATADDKTKVYGANNPALTISYSGFVPGDDVSDLNTQPSASTTANAASDVGTYPITLSGGNDNNYNLVLQNGSLTVTKRSLNATADNKTRAFGESNPPFTISYNGFVNSDNASDLNTEPTLSTTATAASNVGTYPITVSGGNDNNYSFNRQNSTLTVTKANQTITINTITEKQTTDAPFNVTASTTSGLTLSYAIASGPASISGTTITLTGSTGTVVVEVSQAGNGNYNPANETVSFNVVNPALQDQTITFGALSNRTFGDAPFTLSATATSGLPVSFSVVSGPISITGNVVTINGAGTATVRASQPGNGSFNPAPEVLRSFNIDKANQTISFAALANRTFGDAAYELTASASSGLTVSYSLVSGPITISGNEVTITGAGTAEIAANQAGNTNFNAAPEVTQQLIIDKASQTINFSEISDKVFGDVPFNLEASSTSGLAVDFSVVSGPVTLNGGEVTINGAGQVEISANQPGNVNYLAASEVTRTFEVAKADQTITIDPIADKTISDIPFDVVATTTSGLALDYSLTGPATISGATITLDGTPGLVTVTVSQIGDANYNEAEESLSFSVVDPSKADQIITFDAIADKTFGDAAFTLNASASSGLAVVFSVVDGPVTLNGAEVTITGAGVATIAANQPGDASFNPAPEVTQSFMINKADQVITIDPITDKLTTDTPFDVVASTTSGLVLDYSLTGPATLNGTTITLDGAEGEVEVTVSQSGNDNYNPASESVSFNVTMSTKQDQTISFDPISDKTFGDGPFNISATSSSGLPVQFSVVNGAVTINGNQVTINGGGAVTIAANQAGNTEFNAAPEVTQSFVVNRAGQVISVDSIPDKLTTDAPFDVIASTSSGLPLSYSILGPATISGTTITLNGNPGMIELTVEQPGNDNYIPATASLEFEVLDGTITSVVPNQEVVVKIYPNPASEVMRIHHTTNSVLKTWVIVDASGVTVKGNNDLQEDAIPVSDLSEGMYFIRLDFGDFQETKRFMIMR